MFVIIMGCGRAGSLLAATLSSEGHQVTVIDWSTSAFDRLPDDFAGETLLGNGIDVDVLRDAGIERADAFIAGTSGDNRNIMASQIAKTVFDVPRVISRIKDPIRANIYQRLGIEVDCRTLLQTDWIRDQIEERANV